LLGVRFPPVADSYAELLGLLARNFERRGNDWRICFGSLLKRLLSSSRSACSNWRSEGLTHQEIKDPVVYLGFHELDVETRLRDRRRKVSDLVALVEASERGLERAA
jgi:hypothetical protein